MEKLSSAGESERGDPTPSVHVSLLGTDIVCEFCDLSEVTVFTEQRSA